MAVPVSAVPGCAGCPLAERFPANSFIPPKAGASNLLAIGEAPGLDESIQGEAFVGASGWMLDNWFAKVGVQRRDLWMTNVLSCRPKNNWFPTDSKARSYLPLEEAHRAIAHCREAHLLPFLRSRPWDKIYLIGAKALKSVAEKEPLYEWGGTPLPVPALDPERRIAIATMHPAGLMREPELMPIVFCDLKRPLEIPPENYSIYPGPEALLQFYGKPFAIDIETNVPPTMIRMVSLSNLATHAVVIPFQGAYIPALRELLLQATELIGQNIIQFDMPILCRELEIEWHPPS